MRRKCIVIASAVLAALTAGAVSASAAETPHYMGDVNGNGSVEITDVTAIQQHAGGSRPLDEIARVLADVNEDNTVDVIDATLLQLAAADLYQLPHAGKTWHEAVYEYIDHPVGTEQVWVVDQEATSYEEPVYNQKWAMVCKGCGMDVGNDVMTRDERLDHMGDHHDNGEPTGYYSDYIKIQVGTKTVEVPEKGHYETRDVKEAYTEKKPVKEAGWY